MNNAIVICTHPSTRHWLNNILLSLKDYKANPIVVVVNDIKREDVVEQAGETRYTVGEWLGLNSIIVMAGTENYEVGALHTAFERTSFDQFVFLQDSCEIKDLEGFTKTTESFFKFTDASVPITPRFFHFLGKYRRAVLKRMPWPIAATKRQAVELETHWNDHYIRLEQQIGEVLTPSEQVPESSDWYEEKFGRQNMVVENSYIKKYKGTWATGMIKD